MLPEYFAIIGAIIGSLGGFYYLYETIVGKAQPNRHHVAALGNLFPMVVSWPNGRKGSRACRGHRSSLASRSC